MSKKIISCMLIVLMLVLVFPMNCFASSDTVRTYSRSADGDTYLSKNFKVREFACNDGSDKILIDLELVAILQNIRDHFGAPITITSAYRNPTYNAQIGGASNSYHTKGMAADISVSGVSPNEVAKYAETIGVRGIGRYSTSYDGYFVHVDTRPSKSYWIGQSSTWTSTHGGNFNSQPYEWNPTNEPLDQGITATGILLQSGSSGIYVKQLQTSLNTIMDAGLTVDGNFGPATDTAVRAFQTKYGLDVDGKVGSNTIALINDFIKNGVPEEKPIIIRGDTNNDGVINASDFVQIRKAIMNLIQVATDSSEYYDATGDGIYDVRDLVRMKRVSAGLNICVQ